MITRVLLVPIVLAAWLTGCRDTNVAREDDSRSVPAIQAIAEQSDCAHGAWRDRGLAPRPYIAGMALVYARSICEPDRPDVKIVSALPDADNLKTDALVQYSAPFPSGLSPSPALRRDVLRYSYTLLIGLGMMESSGHYCEGRDVSQCFAQAETAEAGLFQTSYGARRSSPVLGDLFARYGASQSGCMLSAFKGSLTCPVRKSHNAKCPDATSDVAGTGPGADWQRLTKICPAFATEYAAVVLRRSGGAKGEFNPIRKHEAEWKPQCQDMLKRVEAYVDMHPSACAQLVTLQ